MYRLLCAFCFQEICILRGAVAVLNRPNSSYYPQAVVLVPTGYARQPLPL